MVEDKYSGPQRSSYWLICFVRVLTSFTTTTTELLANGPYEDKCCSYLEQRFPTFLKHTTVSVPRNQLLLHSTTINVRNELVSTHFKLGVCDMSIKDCEGVFVLMISRCRENIELDHSAHSQRCSSMFIRRRFFSQPSRTIGLSVSTFPPTHTDKESEPSLVIQLEISPENTNKQYLKIWSLRRTLPQ